MGQKPGGAGEDRHSRALYVRLYWALGKLRDGVLSTRSISSRFGVSLRTAYRDLDFLRDSWRVDMEYEPSTRAFVLKGDCLLYTSDAADE